MPEQNIVLLVEDNDDLNQLNQRALELEGYTVLTALTLAEAREHLSRHSPQVILLDVKLPDGDGIDFCGEIRAETDAHILFLTSSTTYDDKVNGLTTGGDDYITKPYKLEELLARVSAVMRRRGMVKPARNIIKGSLMLDTVADIAYLNDEDMMLTQKEFGLLHTLVQNEEKILSKDYLYETVWKRSINDDVRTVMTHISSMRKKLVGSGYVITVSRGEGYCFEKE
jgi:DNA-binding response OmpR family regulator